MMLNEFFKILYTGAILMLLAQCYTVQGPAYLMTEEPQTHEPMTTEQDLNTESVEEPQEFTLPKAEPAAPEDELRSGFETDLSTHTMED